MLVFGVQLSEGRLEIFPDPPLTINSENSAVKTMEATDMPEAWDLLNYQWAQGEPVKLIVGIGASRTQVKDLEEIISNVGGNVTCAISVGEDVRALAVEVSRDGAYSFVQSLQTNELVEYIEPDAKASASFVPNDPYWSSQWGPKKIQADYAWNVSIGSSDVLVAIVDTGIDYTHADLATNYAPLGFDWVNWDSNPMDDNGHGTHCAGIVAAKLSNSLGIAGLAQVRVMAEKVLNQYGSGYYSWITQGIYDAVSKGARIISMSLGGSSDSQPLHDAVKYARDHGVLVVVAAGNSGDDTRQYPAAYEEALAVSATDSSDNLASFSTWGEWVDLSAPGVDIFSTLQSDSYGYMSGTSMACPHVSGVAALVWSVFPTYSQAQIRRILERTADDLGEEGFDPLFSYGRINAKRAVAGLPPHDIALAGWLHPYRIDPGKPVKFNITVANYGTSNETDILVQFFVDQVLIDSSSISFLAVDASEIVSFSWSTANEGNYNVTCYVVPVLGESVTENNVVSSIVSVRFPIILRVPAEYPTIKSSVNNAGDGDTILVSAGLYAEGPIGIFKNNITLRGEGYAVLDGTVGGYLLKVRANDVVIEGFEIRRCGTYDPVYAVDIKGDRNIFRRNAFRQNRECLRVHNSRFCIISENRFTNTGGNGLFLEYSSNCTVSQNILNARSFWGGLNLLYSFNNTITQNILTGGLRRAGLMLCYSEQNFVVANNITGNEYGLVLMASPNNIFRDNVMVNNKRNLCCWKEDLYITPDIYVNDMDSSNLVDGKPVCYWVKEHDRTVPADAGCVVLVYCRNIRVENLSIRNNLDGILLVASHGTMIRYNNLTANEGEPYEISCGGIMAICNCANTTVTLNNCTYNEFGIDFWSGYNNTVTQNNIANSIMWGIEFGSSNSLISDNTLTNDMNGVNIGGSNITLIRNNVMSPRGYGLLFSGTNHNVTLNNFLALGVPGAGYPAFWVSDASNCTISSNNVIGCAGEPAWMWNAVNNVFYHNNFINYTSQVYETDSSNIWDNGYPSGGNYWSNLTSIDLLHGPYQNVTGSDGISDTPYIIDLNNVDRYPLTNPHKLNPPPSTRCLVVVHPKGGYIEPYISGGDTTKTCIYLPNSIVQFKARPELYYYSFDHWELDSINIGSSNPCTIVMDDDHVLEAVFVPTPPLFASISPAIALITLGEEVTFKSSVSGSYPPYYYQWYLNGTEVWDATSPTWTFQPDKKGSYRVYLIVTVQGPGSAKSNEAKMTAVTEPTVIIFPDMTRTYSGQSVEFASVSVLLQLPCSYQWYLDGTPVSGATSANWTFIPPSAKRYDVYLNVTDSVGTLAKSNTALVEAASKLSVLISPTSASVYVGQSLRFTSVASGGYSPYKYQWYVNDTASDGDSSSWTFTIGQPGKYCVSLKVTDSLNCSESSAEALITVTPTLIVSIAPASASICVGQSILFTSTVSGRYPPFRYQWYLNDILVSGATSSSWTFTPVLSQNYTVYLKATDSYFTTQKSTDAFITVKPPLTVTIFPISASVNVNQSVVFISNASGGYPPYSYHWFLNGSIVLGATADSWTFKPAFAGVYHVYLMTTDANLTTSQSEIACVEVIFKAVGGQSFPTQVQAQTALAPYVTLLITIVAVFVKLKHPKIKK